MPSHHLLRNDMEGDPRDQEKHNIQHFVESEPTIVDSVELLLRLLRKGYSGQLGK